MIPHEDHKYFIAFKNGDYTLLDELYQKYAGQTSHWITQNSGTIEDAKDIFQETIIAIFNKAYDIDFVLTYPIGKLIFRISKNKWIDELRKNKSQKKARIKSEERLIDKEDDYLSMLIEIEEEETRQQKLESGFQKLSSRCQKLIKLLFEGIKPKEIVDVLNMNSVNTVYRRKNACMNRWKELYGS